MSADVVDETYSIDGACDEILALIDKSLKNYGSRSLVSATELTDLLLDIRAIVININN